MASLGRWPRKGNQSHNLRRFRRSNTEEGAAPGLKAKLAFARDAPRVGRDGTRLGSAPSPMAKPFYV